MTGGCGQTPPPFQVAGVVPDRAYTDGVVILRVDAGRTRPALIGDVGQGTLRADLASVRATLIPDVSDGRPTVRLETVEWDSVGFTYWMKAQGGLQAGLYTMELVDPHGHTTRLPGAFEGLGPDPLPPTVTVEEFQTRPYLRAGETASAEIVADDGLGGISSLRWDAFDGVGDDCQVEGDPPAAAPRPAPARVTCRVSFPAPALDDPGAAPLQHFIFRVTAWDVAGNGTTLEVPMSVARVPVVESFANFVGALGGYQPFSVQGRFFIEGTRVFIGGVPLLGAAPGGDRRNDQSIVGWTPPHDRAEPARVTVTSPVGSTDAKGLFTYVGPPRPRDIQPPVGPAGGGIRVTVRGNDLRTGVIVYLGATRDARKPLSKVSYDAENKVFGCLPPGSGTVSVWTYDPITGDGQLSDAFTYQDADGGAPAMTDPTCL